MKKYSSQPETLPDLLEAIRKHNFNKIQSENDSEIEKLVCNQIIRLHEHPPITEIETTMGRKISTDQLRQIIFFPCGSQPDITIGALVELLLAIPEIASQHHPLRKVQAVIVSLILLWYSTQWEFVKPFIKSGGLEALLPLMTDENLCIRGQAVESFSRMTDQAGNENRIAFDWFDHRDGQAAVRRRLYDLSYLRFPNYCPKILIREFFFERHFLVHTLLSNSEYSYPGGSLVCLRILAFFLSWMRQLYCSNGILKLSPQIMQALEKWQVSAHASQEERGLAGQLHKDFSRWPAAGAETHESGGLLGATWPGDRELKPLQRSPATPPAHQPPPRATRPLPRPSPQPAGPDPALSDSAAAARSPGRRAREAPRPARAEPAAARGGEAGEGAALKERGNYLLKQGRYQEAEELYTKALLLPGAPTSAVLLNRALARISRASGLPLGGDRALLARGAMEDCVQVVSITTDSVAISKAMYRQALALEMLGRLQEALRFARDACSATGMEDKSTVELVNRLNAAVAAERRNMDRLD